MTDTGTEAAEPRRRRSRAAVKRAKQREAARRVDRDQSRSVRVLCRRSEGYTGRLATDVTRERDRARLRLFQEAGIHYIEELRTPQAKLFDQFIKDKEAAAVDAKRGAQASADPLNITGHTKKPTEKQLRKRSEAERIAAGDRWQAIPDPEHHNQDVVITTRAHSIWRKDLVKTHHQAGVEAFMKDMEAVNGGMRSAGLGDKVDRSGMPSLMPASIPAAQRLERCQTTLAKVHWNYAVGYLLFNLNPTELRRRGAKSQSVTLSSKITDALDALCGFYDKAFRHQDRDLNLLEDIVSNGIQVILRGEHLLNWPHST